MYQMARKWPKLIDAALVEHEFMFSHGDLRSENILISPETLRIKSVIDWAGAGCYPRFWDHFVAAGTRYTYATEAYEDWKDIYTQVFPLYPKEVAALESIYKMIQIYGGDIYRALP